MFLLVHGCNLSQMYDHQRELIQCATVCLPASGWCICVELTHPNVHFTSEVHEMIFSICTYVFVIDSLMRC